MRALYGTTERKNDESSGQRAKREQQQASSSEEKCDRVSGFATKQQHTTDNDNARESGTNEWTKRASNRVD